jgi:hypothetical protein
MKGRATAPIVTSLVAAVLSCAIALSACGGGGPDEGARPPSSRAPSSRATPSRPDRPRVERATGLHLSRSDCATLARAVEVRLQVSLRRQVKPTPPLSRCRLTGPGVAVNLYLDTAYAAHQRYKNRMVEQAQFGAPNPARLPHPVPAVGDPAAYGGDASWVPAYSSLFAVRGNRFLTVAFSVAGTPAARLRAEAAALARTAFRLTTA